MKCTYGTGVYHPDGVEEQVTVELCCECETREGEIEDHGFWFCEDCFEHVLARRAEDEMEEMLEYWRAAEEAL